MSFGQDVVGQMGVVRIESSIQRSNAIFWLVTIAILALVNGIFLEEIFDEPFRDALYRFDVSYLITTGLMSVIVEHAGTLLINLVMLFSMGLIVWFWIEHTLTEWKVALSSDGLSVDVEKPMFKTKSKVYALGDIVRFEMNSPNNMTFEVLVQMLNGDKKVVLRAREESFIQNAYGQLSQHLGRLRGGVEHVGMSTALPQRGVAGGYEAQQPPLVGGQGSENGLIQVQHIDGGVRIDVASDTELRRVLFVLSPIPAVCVMLWGLWGFSDADQMVSAFFDYLTILMVYPLAYSFAHSKYRASTHVIMIKDASVKITRKLLWYFDEDVFTGSVNVLNLDHDKCKHVALYLEGTDQKIYLAPKLSEQEVHVLEYYLQFQNYVQRSEHVASIDMWGNNRFS